MLEPEYLQCSVISYLYRLISIRGDIPKILVKWDHLYIAGTLLNYSQFFAPFQTFGCTISSVAALRLYQVFYPFENQQKNNSSYFNMQ